MTRPRKRPSLRRHLAETRFAQWQLDVDLAELNRWILGLHDGDAKAAALKLRASMRKAYWDHDAYRLSDQLSHLLTLRELLRVQRLADQAAAAERQRRQASENAARERNDEARAAHALVQQLAQSVPERIKGQGTTAIAREVRRLAARTKPPTDVAIRVAAYSDRTLRKLISGK